MWPACQAQGAENVAAGQQLQQQQKVCPGWLVLSSSLAGEQQLGQPAMSSKHQQDEHL
jgi:hypothetical protein